MATIGNLIIGISVNLGPLNRGLNTARGQLRGFVGATIDIGGALRVAERLFARVADEIGKDVQAASDLNEQVNKSRVVFGDVSATVEADAQRMADAFGVPKRVFIDAASSIGLMGEAAGLSAQDSAALGDRLAELGLDAASFYNVPVDVALDKIRSGLAGQPRPLREFGVLLSDDAVKAETLRQGLVHQGEALTEGMKVQARATLIVQGLAKAHGDLARTSGEVANQTRELAGRAENLRADLGSAFLDAGKALEGGLNKALVGLGERIDASKENLHDWAKTAVESGGFINEAIGFVGRALGKAADVVATVRLGFLGLQAVGTAALARLVKAIDLVGKGLEALVNLLPGVEVHFTSFTETLADDLLRLSDQQFAHFQMELAKPPPSEGIGQFFDDLRSGAAAAAQALDQTGEAVQSLANPLEDVAKKVDDLRAKLQLEADTFGMNSDQVEIYKLQLAGASAADLTELSALADQVAGLEATKKAMGDLVDEADKVFEQTRTPFEKFEAQLAKLQELSAQGLIDPDTFGRGIDAALEDLAGKTKTEEFKSAGAFELGSKEARTAVLEAQGLGGGGDSLKDLSKTNKDQVGLQSQMVGLLRQVVGAVQGGLDEVFTF